RPVSPPALHDALPIYPCLQPGQPAPVAEHPQVVVTERLDPRLDDGADLGSLILAGEPQPGVEALSGGVVARRPAEDEVDGGQHRSEEHTSELQSPDHL